MIFFGGVFKNSFLEAVEHSLLGIARNTILLGIARNTIFLGDMYDTRVQ
jgi:hypothetical protein